MNKQQSKISSVVITLIICGAIIYLSNIIYHKYVLTAPCVVAILIGFLPPFLSGGKYPMPLKETYELSFFTLGLSIVLTLIFASKNILPSSLTITIPALAPIIWLFSYLAFRINDRRIFKVKDFFRVLPIIILLNLGII